jgi:hypothetical protein
VVGVRDSGKSKRGGNAKGERSAFFSLLGNWKWGLYRENEGNRERESGEVFLNDKRSIVFGGF